MTCLHVFVPCYDARFDLRLKRYLPVINPICCVEGLCFIYVIFVLIYIYWGSTRFPYQMIFVSITINVKGITNEPRTAATSASPEFTHGGS